MKTIQVKPVEQIKIELEDTFYVCAFNMLAMAHIQEEIGKLDCKISEVSPARMCAILLYGGIRQGNDSFTMEEAEALAIQMGPGNYGTIMEIYNDSLMDSMDEKQRAITKKMIAQYLSAQN